MPRAPRARACARRATSRYRESARAVSGSDSPRESCSSSGRQRDRGAAEVRHRDRERDARPRRVLREVEAERRAREERLLRVARAASTARSRIASASAGARSEMRSRSRPGERDGQHPQRSFAAATAAATSPRRGAGRRRLERPGAHARGDLLVRVAERHAVADERLGGVGREQQRIGRGGGEPPAVELEPGDEHRQRRERAARRRAAPRTPAACPPGGRGRTRAAGP